MKKALIAFLIIAAVFYFIERKLEGNIVLEDRSYYFEEKVIIKDLHQSAQDLNIWIPYPVTDKWQSVESFQIEGPFDTQFITDEEYGNKIVYLKLKGSTKIKRHELSISFKVNRKEYAYPVSERRSSKELVRFLQPNLHVVINDEIRRLAREITKKETDDLDKVRAIYDYIIEEFRYSKDDPQVCGVGDTFVALEHKKGNCSDYHTLFLSLVRSLGIPARFEIGFPVPKDKGEGKIGGYHCWAKFYINGKGWIPVDISEADKHPDKKDYFFGHIDENRIHMVTGRDITLEYAKDSQPLNFFIYPYAELSGKQFGDIEYEFFFKELKGGG